MLNHHKLAMPDYCTRSPLSGWGARHTLAVLGCLGFFVSFSLRVNISMAIVAMVNHTALHELAHHHAAGLNSSAAPDIDICHPGKTAQESEEHVFTEVRTGYGPYLVTIFSWLQF